jgi:hypothetical protein
LNKGEGGRGRGENIVLVPRQWLVTSNKPQKALAPCPSPVGRGEFISFPGEAGNEENPIIKYLFSYLLVCLGPTNALRNFSRFFWNLATFSAKYGIDQRYDCEK